MKVRIWLLLWLILPPSAAHPAQPAALIPCRGFRLSLVVERLLDITNGHRLRVEAARRRRMGPDGASSSVEIAQRTPTPEGEVLTLQAKDGRTLFSRHGQDDGNPQGDPSWFILRAQVRQVARFFGFEELGGERIQVPSPERLNSAIERINTWLHAQGMAPLGVRFYWGEQKQPPLEYLERFASRGELPIARQPIGLFVHDISYHAGTIFIPNEIVQFVRQSTQDHLTFLEYARQQDPAFFSSAEGLDWQNRFLEFQTGEVDNLGTFTGNSWMDPSDPLHWGVTGAMKSRRSHLETSIYLTSNEQTTARMLSIYEAFSREYQNSHPDFDTVIPQSRQRVMDHQRLIDQSIRSIESDARR